MSRTRDPETGYIGEIALGKDLGRDSRCVRCGGRGMRKWPPDSVKHEVLCLHCSDEWFDKGHIFLDKHKYVWSHKKWWAAFNEFLATKPTEVDIASHNRRIEAGDRILHRMFPGGL